MDWDFYDCGEFGFEFPSEGVPFWVCDRTVVQVMVRCFDCSIASGGKAVLVVEEC